uniref:Uncharacterized protein n=1 Tax=Anguilla anguilla TaxID=7936 RepID=A0A0E9XV94_ANGAN
MPELSLEVTESTTLWTISPFLPHNVSPCRVIQRQSSLLHRLLHC